MKKLYKSLLSILLAVTMLFSTSAFSQAVYAVSEVGSTENIDGEEETVFSFYCYTTLWSEYVEPLFDDETEQTRKRLMYVGEEDEIDRIYYGQFDSDDPLTPGYDYASVLAGPDMEVVWEK